MSEETRLVVFKHEVTKKHKEHEAHETFLCGFVSLCGFVLKMLLIGMQLFRYELRFGFV